MGYSSVLEFQELPLRIVIGDTQAFQVEKLGNSLVVKTTVPFATTNMFVYFKTRPTQLLILTASEESEPTYFKRFEDIQVPKRDAATIPTKKYAVKIRGIKLVSSKFDAKKDYLTIEVTITADASSAIRPDWEKIRITSKGNALVPSKLWSERKEAQKDSSVRARFIFTKPNVSRDLKGVALVVPLIGETAALRANL
jgi:hypothetical protein